MRDERMFPVLHPETDCPGRVPWAFLADHNAQALQNHGQSLETLASRGGLGSDEMVAVVENRDFRRMAPGEAKARLRELLTAWQNGPDGELTRLRTELAALKESYEMRGMAHEATQARLAEMTVIGGCTKCDCKEFRYDIGDHPAICNCRHDHEYHRRPKHEARVAELEAQAGLLLSKLGDVCEAGAHVARLWDAWDTNRFNGDDMTRAIENELVPAVSSGRCADENEGAGL